MEGVTTPLRCHSDGVPQPEADWQVAQYSLPDDKKRYEWSNDNTTVYILSPHRQYDSADYECIAKSNAGWSLSKTHVLVQKKSVYSKESSKPTRGQYVVFHAEGYTSYEADHCYTTHYIEKHAADFTSHLSEGTKTLTRLCPHHAPCEWGAAVTVNNTVIYVSQPTLNRVVVIDARDKFKPKHVIVLKFHIKSLHYIANTDELWILTGNQPQFQDVVILSRASQGIPTDIHPLLPEHTVFDSVEDIFVAPENSFNHSSRYIFTRRFEQRGLNRIDTVSMSAKGHTDLTSWDCLPHRLHFLAIGGLVIAECENNTNLVIDSITNQVLQKFESGRVHVSPNTRYIVISNNPNKISVFYLQDNATITLTYKHKLQIEISTVSFMDSKVSAGYDLAVTSPDENSVLFMDIKTTKTQALNGLLSGRDTTTHTSDPERLVSTSGEFGYHILLPSRGALFIVNKQYHLISCEWTDLDNMQQSVWIDI